MAKNKKPVVKEKEETALQQLSVYLLEMFISVFVFVLLTIYPLYYHDKYFDMGDAKYAFFKTTCFIFLGLLLASFVMWIIAFLKKESFDKIFLRYTVTDWFAVAFLIISYVSFLLSGDKNMAFYGYDGWNMGFLSQAMFVLIYLFVAKYWNWSPTTLLFAIFAAGIAYFFAVVMRFGFDPMEMYTNLGAKDIEKFVSTLGQTTWYSSYAVLIFPIGMFWYYNDEKLWTRIVSGIFIVLGTMSLCTVNSDSAYIAFVLIFMVFFWYAIEDNKKFLRYLEMAIMVLASCKLVGILQDLFPERLIELVSGEEKISKFVTHNIIMLIALIGVILLYIGLRVAIKKSYNPAKKEYSFQIGKFKFLRKVMVAAAIVVIWIVILLILLTTNHKLPSFLNSLYDASFMNFRDEWGNHRGFNWRAAITALKNASFKDLLIGVGPDSFCYAMDQYCEEEVNTYWNGLKLACAHNEFLNMLVTEGILGFVAYIGIMISSFVRCAKLACKEAAAIPVMAIIAAYMGHNFFCYQQCICTPILFIFIGIGEVVLKSAKADAN